MAERQNQVRVWIAASLHRRIKAIKRRTGQPMLKIANELIRDGLKVEAGMQKIDRLTKARRDGRGSGR